MSEIKLFRLTNGNAREVSGAPGRLEKPLQLLMERNLDSLFGVRFVATEHVTGKVHGGRIDTLGIDEDGCPVIFEYKRTVSENVINQGLYYLDWLMDHRADFKLLVLDRFGKDTAELIDWTSPRLICVASDFTKHDEHAVRQINRNIDLVRYRLFGDDLLALELLTTVTADGVIGADASTRIQEATGEVAANYRSKDKPASQAIAELEPALAGLWADLRQFILGLGSDVSEKQLKLYVAFRRIRNFATVCVQKKGFYLYLHLDPSTLNLEPGFSRDVRQIGHWGTGDLELWITDRASAAKAEPLIRKAYEGE